MRLSFVWWGAGRWRGGRRGGSQLREASALSKPLEQSPLTRWRSWCLFCVLSMRPSARSPAGPVTGIPPAAGRLARAGLLSEPDKGLRASACRSTRTAAAPPGRRPLQRHAPRGVDLQVARPPSRAARSSAATMRGGACCRSVASAWAERAPPRAPRRAQKAVTRGKVPGPVCGLAPGGGAGVSRRAR